jgi:hypothetical protein
VAAVAAAAAIGPLASGTLASESLGFSVNVTPRFSPKYEAVWGSAYHVLVTPDKLVKSPGYILCVTRPTGFVKSPWTNASGEKPANHMS